LAQRAGFRRQTLPSNTILPVSIFFNGSHLSGDAHRRCRSTNAFFVDVIYPPLHRTRSRGLNISAELPDETLPEQANAEQDGRFAVSEQTGAPAPTTTMSSTASGSSGAGTSATTTALENGPHVEARSRLNTSAHSQVDPIS
jgi:hypothetical protein